MIKKELGIIVLAAGMGRRIGKPKALLPIEDEIFLTRIHKILESFSKDIRFVVNLQVLDFCKCENINLDFVQNSNISSDMIDSLKLGIKSIPNHSHYLIFPVDHPFVKKDSVSKIVNSYKERDNWVAPKYEGKTGHPIIVSHKVAKIILETDSIPLNKILQNFTKKEVPVADKGVLKNINTKKDCDRFE